MPLQIRDSRVVGLEVESGSAAHAASASIATGAMGTDIAAFVMEGEKVRKRITVSFQRPRETNSYHAILSVYMCEI